MTAALLVIDLQRGFDDTAHWGPRDNPACEANVRVLVDAFRRRPTAARRSPRHRSRG